MRHDFERRVRLLAIDPPRPHKRGYCGAINARLDDLLACNSPFFLGRLAESDYLRDPRRERFDVVKDADFLAYTWLYANVHHFDYIILHQWPGAFEGPPEVLARLKRSLADATCFEDRDAIVYDVRKLPLPDRATVVCLDGWRTRNGWKQRYSCVVGRNAELAVYNPDPNRPLVVSIEAAAARVSKTARLLDAGGATLALWHVVASDPRTYSSPPFRLPRGATRLTLASDSEDAPRNSREAASETDRRPYSLHVSRVTIAPVVMQAEINNKISHQR